jgi:putative phosphoribosyl transferase
MTTSGLSSLSAPATPPNHMVRVHTPGGVLKGILAAPERASGVVLFAHGAGSSRFSPRNQFVARQLHRAGLATLLMDLLTASEEATDEAGRTARRFDIPLLADRLTAVIDWTSTRPETRDLPVGCFGSSTGAAAALVAAASRPDRVAAVVSRGGRPDLAIPSLAQVRAPTLLIVGGKDLPVLELNELALTYLQCPKALRVVPDASHLFEEPGTLEQVADLAAEWFGRFLASPAAANSDGGVS